MKRILLTVVAAVLAAAAGELTRRAIRNIHSSGDQIVDLSTDRELATSGS